MTAQMAQRQRHVAHPVSRFGIFMAIAGLMLLVAVAWATDGFTTIHRWDVKWVDQHYKDTINY